MKCVPSARLEEQNGHLAQVEVDKMLGLVSHIAAEVSPDDAVPGWVVLLIKLLLGDKQNMFQSSQVSESGVREENKNCYAF